MKDERLAERCRSLRLVLLDVDGVLTDGRLLLHPDGSESKSFHVRDGLGIVVAQRAGLEVGILSGRTAPVVDARARELGIALVRQGAADKAAAFHEILAAEGLRNEEVGYMGDDLPDLPVLVEAGLSAAPGDAPFEVRMQAFMVTEAHGGQGCVREFLEAVLRARGQWDDLVAGPGPRRP